VTLDRRPTSLEIPSAAEAATKVEDSAGARFQHSAVSAQLFENFSAKRGEVTDKEFRLFRRLRCEKVALRADWLQRSLRKSAISVQPSAIS